MLPELLPNSCAVIEVKYVKTTLFAMLKYFQRKNYNLFLNNCNGLSCVSNQKEESISTKRVKLGNAS